MNEPARGARRWLVDELTDEIVACEMLLRGMAAIVDRGRRGASEEGDVDDEQDRPRTSGIAAYSRLQRTFRAHPRRRYDHVMTAMSTEMKPNQGSRMKDIERFINDKKDINGPTKKAA